MLLGRRYLLQLSPGQEQQAEQIAGACRAVWNVGLEQRRLWGERGQRIGYVEQCRQLADAKQDPFCGWLSEAPSHCLQQTLRDLDGACRRHGPRNVHWRSKTRSRASFRFPYPPHIKVRRISRRWGEVRLPKLGRVRFRWTRPLGGEIRNATVLRDGNAWYISFTVDDARPPARPNGRPPVGVDLGVTVAVVTSDGWLRDRPFITPGEAKRLKRLQRQLARCGRGSNRRATVRGKLARLHARVRHRRADFNAWTADRLTRDHGLVIFEDLRIRNMTASSKGTLAAPGSQVRQKAGLNRRVLDKGWGDLRRRVAYKAEVNGSRLVRVPAAFTSQTCAACGHCAPENRKSQAVFRCVACGHQAPADVNGAINVLGAGLALTGRGDLAVRRSVKRQPPDVSRITRSGG